MDIKELSIDKKEEKHGLVRQDASSPSAGLSAAAHSTSATEQDIDLTPIGDVLAEPESSFAANSGTKKRAFISKGERIHKWGTYLSVDWIFNAATGVGFAYWGKYSDLGKKIWSGPITEGFTKALRPFIKNPEQLKKSAGYGNMFMSVIAGGMFTIPPLMMLENKKVRKSITKFFDGLIYGKDKVENDPKFQVAYDEIDHAPKKDFTNGLLSRFVALSPLLAMVLIPVTKKFSNRIWFDHVENASAAVAKKIGFSENSFKSVPLSEAKNRWKFIHESVAMDFGLGVPYAILHAYFYNMFASKKKNHKNDGAEPALALTAPQTSPAAEPVNEPISEKRFTAQHPAKTTADWQTSVSSSDREPPASRRIP